MHFFKFSFLSLLLSTSIFAFDDNACFKGNFEVEVIHKGKPFGLLPVVLKIQKTDCDIKIYHEELKFKKTSWKVDVCREPVHIKKGLGAVEVIKKTAACSKGVSDSFCSEFRIIEKNIQDDGLIFAEGQKESLETNHGKTYCAYVLLQKYLDESLVFTRGRDYSGVLTGQMRKDVLPEKEALSPKEVQVVPRPIVEGVEASTQDEKGSGSMEKVESEKAEEKPEEKGKGFF